MGLQDNGIRVDITQEDIDLGVKGFTHGCAVARALRRTLNTDDIQVYTFEAHIKDKIYKLPEQVSSFITNFDMGRTKVSPSSFVLYDYKTDKRFENKTVTTINKVEEELVLV